MIQYLVQIFPPLPTSEYWNTLGLHHEASPLLSWIRRPALGEVFHFSRSQPWCCISSPRLPGRSAWEPRSHPVCNTSQSLPRLFLLQCCCKPVAVPSLSRFIYISPSGEPASSTSRTSLNLPFCPSGTNNCYFSAVIASLQLPPFHLKICSAHSSPDAPFSF